MDTAIQVRQPWKKGLIVGQKRPLLPRQIWSIRVRLEMSASARGLALFNLAIDSKLRASDLVRLKVEDVCSGPVVRDRAVVSQDGNLRACSCYLATPKSRQPSAISVSRWMTRCD